MYSLLGVQSVADVVRHGRLRWLGHLERKGVDDWVSACMEKCVSGGGEMCGGRGRMTWEECVKDGMKLLGLQPEFMGNIQGCLEGLHTWGKRITLAWHGTEGRFKNK